MVKPTICNSDAKTPVIPEFCDDGLWEVPVNSLSEIKKADRDHAYILPDDSVWVLSHDGKNFIQLNLVSSGEGQPTNIDNSDEMIVVKGSGTYDVSVDLDMDQVVKALVPSFQAKKVTADDGAAFIKVAANETILARVLQYGAGFRTGMCAVVVADSQPNSNATRFEANMITDTAGVVTQVDTANNIWSRIISKGAWLGDWEAAAPASKAQLSKVTADDGSQIAIANAQRSLLKTILDFGIGFRAITASPDAEDNPTIHGLRGVAIMNTSVTGNFMGMASDGRQYSRAIAYSEWAGEWQVSITKKEYDDILKRLSDLEAGG